MYTKETVRIVARGLILIGIGIVSCYGYRLLSLGASISRVHSLASATEVRTLKSGTVPVLFKVGATWCPICKQMKSTEAAFAQLHPELIFASLDIDTAQPNAKRELSGVMGLPTYIFWHAGEQGRAVGAQSQAQLEALVAHK